MIFIDHFKWLSIFNGCYAIGEKFRVNATTGENFAYNLFYDGQAVDYSSPLTDAGSGFYNLTKKVAIAYTGKAAEDMTAGTYADTLTFTITAK
ncbi:MAG: hypothetical protein ISR65_16445 [Bacteriovoracaceae bacterium]|nr:hypothetical protein [Bacteriovoracaceae bacterium]